MLLTCSRCGTTFERDNEFSLLGYRQCLPCDYRMFGTRGSGGSWPEPDDGSRRPRVTTVKEWTDEHGGKHRGTKTSCDDCGTVLSMYHLACCGHALSGWGMMAPHECKKADEPVVVEANA
jgi:DNA-directed RNA polymerase subunit RPC12/RpoP